MWSVNLRSVTCYTDQNIESKCSFRSSKSLYLEEKKRFKESNKMSVNVGVLWNVLQHFNFICAQSWWKNLIAILWKKRIPVSYLSMKILSQYTVNCRRRKSNGRDSSFFCLTINPFNKSYDSSWQSSLPFAECFQRPTKERCYRILTKHNVQFFKRFQRHIDERTHPTVLLVLTE